VLHVGMDIENIRVGKMVNWEKVVLNVQTDGTISFEDAFTTANQILIDQFSALQEIAANPGVESSAVEPVEEEAVAPEELTEETEEPKKKKSKSASAKATEDEKDSE
jgi:DNA-directed RNA polymerase alpha subunit